LVATVTFVEEQAYKLLRFSLCFFVHLLLSPSSAEVFSTVFSHSLNVYSFLGARDHVLNPYKTTGKITV
jgi:hypothetical protein